MNTANRLFVALGALLLGGLAIAVLVAVGGGVSAGFVASIPMASEALQAIQSASPPDTRLIMLSALTALVLVWLFLWLLLRGHRAQRQRAILISQSPSGTMSISRAGLARLIEHVALEQPDVLEARGTVNGRERLEALCDARIAPSAEAPAVSRVLQDRLRTVLETQLGRPVQAVNIHTQFGPLAGSRSATRVH